MPDASAPARPPLGYQLELTVKATRLCNLRCTYCEDWRTGPGQVMSDEVVEQLIAKALGDPQHRVINFGWHGGEPLVLPVAFYERALALQARHRMAIQRVGNSIQTNAVLMTDEWARFLGDNDITVGVSIDGPPEVHDAVRVSKVGAPTFDSVMAGLERLQANDVPYGVLVTVDESMIAMEPDEVLDFLVSLGAEGCGLNAVRPSHRADPDPSAPMVTWDQMGPFLIDLYEARRRRGIDFPIREIDSVRTRLRKRGTASCQLAGECIGTFFVVEPNGDIGHCARFIDDEHYQFGNIVGQTFTDIRRALRLVERRAENTVAVAEREGCDEFAVCQGGCPHERVVDQRHSLSFDAGCCGRADLIGHLRNREIDDVVVAIGR